MTPMDARKGLILPDGVKGSIVEPIVTQTTSEMSTSISGNPIIPDVNDTYTTDTTALTNQMGYISYFAQLQRNLETQLETNRRNQDGSCEIKHATIDQTIRSLRDDIKDIPKDMEKKLDTFRNTFWSIAGVILLILGWVIVNIQSDVSNMRSTLTELQIDVRAREVIDEKQNAQYTLPVTKNNGVETGN